MPTPNDEHVHRAKYISGTCCAFEYEGPRFYEQCETYGIELRGVRVATAAGPPPLSIAIATQLSTQVKLLRFVH